MEVIKIGKHEVYNGCSIQLLKSMPSGFLGGILTDPPFGQGKANKEGEKGKAVAYGRSELGHREIKNDTKDFLLKKMPQFAKEAFRVLENNSWCVLFWQWRTYAKLEEIMLKAGFDIKTVGIWDKKNSGLGSGLAEGYEFIIFFRKGKARETIKLRSNVFRFARVSGRTKHPHQKPEKLARAVAQCFIKEGMLVGDFFSGSGALGRGIMEEGGVLISCEEDPKHFQTTLKAVRSKHEDLTKEPSLFTASQMRQVTIFEVIEND